MASMPGGGELVGVVAAGGRVTVGKDGIQQLGNSLDWGPEVKGGGGWE